jgi:hypothetical protein
VREVAAQIKVGEVWVFEQRLFYYYFDHIMEPSLVAAPWLGTTAVKFAEFGRLLPEQVRREWAMAAELKSPRHSEDVTRHMIADGGWHLSYFGGDAARRYKSANFAHGAGGVYGDARDSQPIAIQQSTAGVRPLDSAMLSRVEGVVSHQLKGDVPSAVANDLPSYYHHFGAAYV